MALNSEPDPLESISKGATKGVIEWSSQQIKELVRKFNDRELLFIEDKETIDIVKNQRKKPELNFYRKYIKDHDLRLQVEMGFSLRQLGNEPDKLGDLKEKIVRRYGREGVYVAEFVQLGVFTKYASLLLGDTQNEKELEDGLNEILKNIEKYVLFVKASDDEKRSSGVVVSRINSNIPRVFILFSKGSVANNKAKRILEFVKTQILGYGFQTYVEDAQQYFFILKSPSGNSLVSFLEDKKPKDGGKF